jgi:ABC-type cobalamin transport system permease subunit
VILKARARRVSTATTLCLIVVSVGIICGKILYNHYISGTFKFFFIPS